MKKNKKQITKKHSDPNLALISVILGGASFTNSVFTGIPAIIIGIIAMKRNAGNRTQAKLGIFFGIVGSLLIIPIVLLLMHFFKAPLKEQYSVPEAERKNLVVLAEKLREYKKQNKHYPSCSSTKLEQTCVQWDSFISSNNITKVYPTFFENTPNNIEDRPPGTLVYAQNTTCLINIPTNPSYVENDNSINPEDYAALVYFYEGGRFCLSVEKAY